MKKLIMLAVLTAAAALFADPSVTLSRVQQRYPWNGYVDIDYAISGMTVPEDYVLRFKMSWTDDAGDHVAVATNFLDHADVDLPLADGSHRVTWDTKADGLTFAAKGVRAEIQLLSAPYTMATARYLIVDVSGGKNATTYPVRLTGPTDARVFNKDQYKLSKIVLKRNDAGSFYLCHPDETTLQYVTLTKDYFLGLFMLTRKQYWYVMGTNIGGCPYADADSCPQQVYYGDTRGDDGVLAKLSSKAQFKGAALPAFTYPTEAQWERTCRAGTTSKFFDGSDGSDATEVAKYAWLKDCGSDSHVHGVGQKLPNPWGYYDMIGNLWEGCSDWDGAYPGGTVENPAVDPTGAATGDKRVAKGSSNNYNSGYWGTSSTRYGIEEKYNTAGIRLGMTLP